MFMFAHHLPQEALVTAQRNHEAALAAQKSQHEVALAALKTQHESALGSLQEKFEASLAAMVSREQHEKILADLREQHMQEASEVIPECTFFGRPRHPSPQCSRSRRHVKYIQEQHKTQTHSCSG